MEGSGMITGETKLEELFAQYSWLSGELALLNDKFKALSTPLGRVMLKKATIAELSKRGEMEERELIRKIEELIIARAKANPVVTGDMLIGDLITLYPDAVEALMEVGMHCVGCGVSATESLTEASYVHGLDPEMVVQRVNAKLQA